jgi:acetamidase/formamidase/AraC-like DNA-binding protein
MHVNIDALPVSRQWGKWRELLAALGLSGERGRRGCLSAEAFLLKSPSGAAVARLRASSEKLSYRVRKETRECVFVVLHQHGCGQFEDGLSFEEGAVSVCDGQASWRLVFEGRFEVLLLRINRARIAEPFGRRLVGPPMILGEGPFLPGIQALLLSLFRDLDQLDVSELVPIENALIELLTAALHKEHDTFDGEVTQVQAAHFQRVKAIIDAHLTKPDLSLREVAERAGISRRYLQKLFTLHGTTFSELLKSRRLDLVRHALVQESERSASIADIAFRCGFSNPGHFSRVFRATFGLSPRAYRAMKPRSIAGPERHRGRPSGVRDGNTAAKCLGLLRSPMASDVITSAPTRYRIAASASTVHWGFISNELPPVLRVRSGAEVVIETLTQHASDDWERMVKGDTGAESVFNWTANGKNVERRGAGPLDASVVGRGAGEGFGVHILTGPVYIEEAEPGDILEINILDIVPRPSGNPEFAGRCFAVNAATWWGFHYSDFIDPEKRREIVTVFEVEPRGEWARAVYSYRWTPQVDPYGIRHDTIDYPGVPVDHSTIEKHPNPIPNVRIPLRPHFGVMTVMPKEPGLVDSIPPGYFGGNFDNWRAGKGSTVYLPVGVPGALFSVGDGHIALGDGEVNGTGLECSLTGTFRFKVHKRGRESKRFLRGLAGPLIESREELILHGFSYPNYLRDLGRDAQAEVYKRSCLDRALRSAFQFSRKFLMDGWGLDEDAAITVLSTAVDFGITQVANGNWGVHVTIPKRILISVGEA